MSLLQTLSLQINANKFICDREAKALGLKGPVDFIEGEDGCDKRIEEYMKNKARIAESSGDKKAFDVCVMNPPYDRNLHLKILEKVIPHCEETINISPIRWLQDPLAKYKKNSDYNKFKESVAEHIKDFDFVLGRNVFDADIGTVGIIHCDNEKHDACRKTSKVSSAFYKIADNLPQRMSDVIVNDDFDGLCCSTSLMVLGSRDESLRRKFGWLTHSKDKLYYKDKKNEATGETYYEYRKRVSWGNLKPKATNTNVKFKTEEERDNFYDSYRTTIMRWYYCEQTVDVNVHPDFLPWMGNVEDGYKSPWDNKRFCDYFNITGYISDTEAEPNSEWEEILNTMRKYK